MPAKRAYKRDGSTVTRTYTILTRSANKISEYARERGVSLGAVLDAVIRYAEWDKVDATMPKPREDIDAEV